MRSLTPIIASNGLAILVTTLFLLPIISIFSLVVTAPLDDFSAYFGLWLHNTYSWSLPEFDTQERFEKIGFAIRVIFISVGISFFYYWITNWMNMGFALLRMSSC